MSTLELKEKLIGKILQTESRTLLNEVLSYLKLEDDGSEVVKITPQQKKAIREGLEDFKNGRVLTDEQADKEIQEWLNK